MSWVLGLDGGGSKTALAYADAGGQVHGPYLAPGINPFDQPGWAATLAALLRAHPAPGPLAGATLGLPGYGESPEVSARQRLAAAELVSAPTRVLNDVEVAFVGAFAGGPGALLLAGTGSMAWAGDGARQVRSGGWGEGFGDEGSAHWTGRQALSLATQALDGRLPDRDFADALLGRVFGHLPDQAEVLGWFHRLPHERSGVAALARIVDELADAGQPTARALLADAAGHLARHVQATRTLLGLPDLPWSHAGSVLNSATVGAELRARLGPPTPPRLSPLGGALWHAARAAGWAADADWQGRVHGHVLYPAPDPLSLPT